MVTQNWKDLMEHVYAHSQTVGHVHGMLSWEEGGAGTLLGGCMCIYIHMYVDARGQSQVCAVPQKLPTLFIETRYLTEARAYRVG